MTDNGALTIRLVKAQRRLGDILAKWPRPPMPNMLAALMPELQTLPDYLVSHIISFMDLSDDKRGAILVAIAIIAIDSRKAALRLIEPIKISTSIPCMVQLLENLLKELNLESVADLRNLIANRNQRCHRLTCGVEFTRRQSPWCRFHTGIAARDHQQHSLSLTRPAWIGRYRRQLSLAPYACCGGQIDNSEQCRMGYHIGELEDMLLFGYAVIAGVQIAFQRPYNDDAMKLALQFLTLDGLHFDIDEFEWGIPASEWSQRP